MTQSPSPVSLDHAVDYGIDAPGVRGGMALGGMLGVAVAATALVFGAPTAGGAWALARPWVMGAGALAAAYGCGMAAYMTYASRVGKRRTRDRLLDHVAWTGRERVLDVGCGRGLLLLGAAARVPSGQAIGLDRWQAADQSANSPAATRANAKQTGLAERVQVHTGDARALPYADAAFDVVCSHWLVHNLPTADERARALAEMWRVLRPGGALLLADIACHAEYVAYFTPRAAEPPATLDEGLETAIMGALSGGSYAPRALVVRRPASATR